MNVLLIQQFVVTPMLVDSVEALSVNNHGWTSVPKTKTTRYSNSLVWAFGSSSSDLRSISSSPSTNSASALSAVVYGTDGKILDVLDDDDDKTNDGEPTIIPDRRFDSLLAQKFDSKAQLSNLLKVVACAFTEPPHNTILPKDVVVATLVEMTATQIDIALGVKTVDESSGGGGASLAKQQYLVQLLIRVPLSSPCPLLDEESDLGTAVDCVAKSLLQLEPYALARLEKRERGKHQEATDEDGNDDDDWPPPFIQAALEIPKETSSSDTLDSVVKTKYFEGDAIPDSRYRYPDWWIFPSPLEKTIGNECNSMKSLLNEDDFATDRIQLSKQRRDTSGDDDVIQKAYVAIIGPGGLILRTQQMKNEESLNLHEKLVPVRFLRGAVARSPDSLRDLVLELVESLDEYIEEVQEQELRVPVDASMSEQEPISTTSAHATTATVNETLSPPHQTVVSSPSAAISTKPRSADLSEDIIQARRQPKSQSEESKLAARYASIDDIGDRAFAILKDLGMI